MRRKVLIPVTLHITFTTSKERNNNMCMCDKCIHQNVCYKFLYEECKHDNCSDYEERK